MNIAEVNGANIIGQTTSYHPPKDWRTWLIGRPLQTADSPNQTIGKLIGLAVFSSDALSSVAYGPQELITILAIAGSGAIGLSIPIIGAIIGLLLILTLSYEQTIHAYPGGGGAYIVARDNLGELPAQTAGAALLTDYILTVAVSISAGVAQIISAYPTLFPYRVWISVAMVMFIMVINLRGVKESGSTFAIPTYFFLGMMYLTVMVAFVRMAFGTLGVVAAPPMIIPIEQIQPITLFLILKAFSNGTTALTGVEAISNGITAFKEPRSKNAGKTLVFMSLIMGSLLATTTILFNHIAAVPSEQETMISQLGRTVFAGRGIFYLMMISATTAILIMAANTAFADFPRLGALQAGDGFLPRQLTYRGSRLVYSRGIVSLAAIASALIILFQASVNRLIPLYAIGVFLSFTLSQTGMARRWWKSGQLKPGQTIKEPGSTLAHEKNWVAKMIVNGFGAICTFTVMMVFASTKFKDGAYVVVILTPILVAIFFSIRHHYKNLARQLSLDNYGSLAPVGRRRVILMVGGVHRGTLSAMRFARALSNDITALHISIDPQETARIQEKWALWGEGIRLVVLDSPYRVFIEPTLEYITNLEKTTGPNEMISIIVPQFISHHWWSKLLHTRTADTLRKELLYRDKIVITEVPYQIK